MKKKVICIEIVNMFPLLITVQAIAAVALWPIHQQYRIKKLIISTYQAASGAGAEGMDELLAGTEAKLSGKEVVNSVFVHPLPFNLIPHIDKFQVLIHMITL